MSDMSVTGTLNNADGVFDANTQAVTVAGEAIVSGGEYQASSGTQTFEILTVSGGTFSGSPTTH